MKPFRARGEIPFRGGIETRKDKQKLKMHKIQINIFRLFVLFRIIIEVWKIRPCHPKRRANIN